MKIPIRRDDDQGQTEGGKTPDTEPHEATSDRAAPSAPPPPTGAEGHADSRVQELEAALSKMTQEHEARREQLLRLMADFDNYRKRMTRQFEDARQYATMDLVTALLPGMDNLERALVAARQDGSPASTPITEGVNIVLKQFKDALAKVGVRELQVQGEAFDPTRHEAVEVVAVPASQDGRIIEEVQRGYTVHDRLLRPAKVVVGKAAQEASHGGS